MAKQRMGSLTRRHFLKLSVATGGAVALASVPDIFRLLGYASEVKAFNISPTATKFQMRLRGLGADGIPIAAPDNFAAPVTGAKTHYTINVNQFTDQIHPNLGLTTLWGYHPAKTLFAGQSQKHLGGIIVANKGEPIQLTFQNNLPNQHILPVDTTLMGADKGAAQNRITVHLHGGNVPWISDGGPFTWFDASGNYGESVMNGNQNLYKTLNPGLANGQAEYYYPNNQSARFLWYHDHAVGITRLNAYAGLASGLIIRDDFERGLKTQGLPEFVETSLLNNLPVRELPIVIQEKIFIGDESKLPTPQDPTWGKMGYPNTSGSLWYPHVYDPARWALDPRPTPPPDPSCVPEFFGDTMLVNGTVYPYAPVDARRYRFRILNATQARFLNLQLYEADATGTLPDFTKPGPNFLVIGTEGGFLANPVSVNPGLRLITKSNVKGNRTVDPAKPGGSLLTAPAERWDVIVDFGARNPNGTLKYGGKKFILYNDAPAPFPAGAAVNDGPSVKAPNGELIYTNQILLRFEVGNNDTLPQDQALGITSTTSLSGGIDPIPWGLSWTTAAQLPPAGVKIRSLTLNEVFDEFGRLIQMLGTNNTNPLPTGYTLARGATQNFGRNYSDPVSENPTKGATEVWQIANLTGDTHPMHFHLVNVQVLSRQPFNVKSYKGTPSYTGPARGPDSTEVGWKDTVKMNPGEVTTVIMKFDLPQVSSFNVPTSPRTGGYEYVWHCHILEHEEHDMMRPIVVQ